MSNLKQSLRYGLELCLLQLARMVFLCLSFRWASDVGGWLFRHIGPYLPRSKKAQRHIRMCFPELDSQQVQAVLRGMWDNLGRTFAEFFFLEKMDQRKLNEILEVEGIEHLQAVYKQGCMLLSGHLGNWEFFALTLALRGYDPAVVYRTPNNPKVAKLAERARHQYLSYALPKGKAGARKMLEAVKSGKVVCVLVDQKLKEGEPIPFFGIPTMTGTAVARLAIRFDRPILPVRVVRIDGHKLKFCIEPPLHIDATNKDDVNAIATAAMTSMNAVLEKWIREYPAQWIWLHHRWRKRMPD